MAVTLRAIISAWFANGYARLIAARQAQANARIAQYLNDFRARSAQASNREISAGPYQDREWVMPAHACLQRAIRSLLAVESHRYAQKTRPVS
jgi:hypothetical protein